MTPLALVKVDASCDPERAYLLEIESGELTMVVHPSLPREQWAPTFAALFAQRDKMLKRGPRPTCERCGVTSGDWDELANDWWGIEHAAGCPNKPKPQAIQPRSQFA